VGKTTLALMLADSRRDKTVYLDLERPSDLTKLADAELYLRSVADSLVIIDEIQRRPDLFPVMRSLIDERWLAGAISDPWLRVARFAAAVLGKLGRSHRVP
jgi:predicted AAA+ superfamily ATPase